MYAVCNNNIFQICSSIYRKYRYIGLPNYGKNGSVGKELVGKFYLQNTYKLSYRLPTKDSVGNLPTDYLQTRFPTE